MKTFSEKLKTKEPKKPVGAPMNPNLVRMRKGQLKAGVHPSDVASYESKGWSVKK